MKITFPDKSYVAVDTINDKIIISIGAPSQDNPLSFTVNTVDLSKEDFKKLIDCCK